MGVPIFYKDPGMNYKSICLGSLDYEILWVIACIMTFFAIIGVDSMISALISYTVERGFMYLRKWLGTRNLSRKTLIDDKFML